jgi:hypothetical protein
MPAIMEDTMFWNQLRKLRFSLRNFLVLVLGIAIGYSLNMHTWKLLTGRSPYAPCLNM